MTPKEKAIELVEKFKNRSIELGQTHSQLMAEANALIAVDEILNTRPGFPYPYDVGLEIKGIFNIINYPTVYWQEVKQEIELL